MPSGDRSSRARRRTSTGSTRAPGLHNRAGHLLARESDCPNKIALIYERERISFSELAGRVRPAAARLAQRGVSRGDHVGIMAPSSPDFIVVQQALFFLGAVVAPLNIFYKPGEIAHAARSCGLRFVVVANDLRDRMTRLSGPSAEPEVCTILLEDCLGAEDRSGPGPSLAVTPIEPDDTALLLNTSATTGKSKGVMLTAANLAANYDRTPGWLGIGRDDVILCALPLYNTFGLNQCINAMLVTGATMVLLPRFDADRCAAAIALHGCTFLPAVPTMLQKIVDQPRLRPGQLSSVRTIMTGGAPVPASLLGRVLKIIGPATRILTGYGLTEGTALVTLTEVTLDDHGSVTPERSIGRVLGGMTLEIVDEAGDILPVGQIGEIVVSGPNIMAGYHEAPEDSAIAVRRGRLHSGDLGYLDAAGYAYIVDRKKDVIIRGGQNIYPAEIEEVIYQLDDVAEVAVVGEPDPVLGEVTVAYVALRPAAAISTARILAHCAAELSVFKVPAEVRFERELPKGPTGKILRRALRDRVQAAT